jgi:hypothetical protein
MTAELSPQDKEREECIAQAFHTIMSVCGNKDWHLLHIHEQKEGEVTKARTCHVGLEAADMLIKLECAENAAYPICTLSLIEKGQHTTEGTHLARFVCRSVGDMLETIHKIQETHGVNLHFLTPVLVHSGNAHVSQ